MLKNILIACAVIGFSACTFRCDDEGAEKRASVEFKTEKKEIEVPDIDVNKKRTTIEVPEIDVDGDDEELPEE
jgi:hypothetical protein